MKVGTLSRRTRQAGGDAAESKTTALVGEEAAALRDLEQTWVGLVLHLLQDRGMSAPLALGVTSAGRGEGKTTNCLGLSAGLARETGAQALMVECDFGSGSACAYLGLDPRPGLSEHLTEGTPIKSALRPTRVPGLKLLTSGGDASDGGSADVVLSSLRRRLPGLIADLRDEYPYIVVDLPPLLTNVYARHLSQALDGVLLSVREGVTEAESIPRAMQDIGSGRLLSAIMVGGQSSIPSWLTRLLPE